MSETTRSGEEPLRILYHHRTQAEDAQGVHIHEIIKNFKALGHEVEEVALVPAADGPNTSSRPKARGGLWAGIAKIVPNFAYELMEMAYNVVGYCKLARAIRRFRPHFIYERYSLYTACGIWASRRHDIPLILEINAPLSVEQEKLGKLTFKRIARRAERWVASNSTWSITVSTPMKETFVDLGVPPDHIVVVPNGVDPEHFHGRDTAGEVRRKYGLAGKRVMGFVGWVREWHGLVELAAAMGEWEDRLSDVHLLIVGDGPAREAIMASAAQAGVADRVHITGAVERSAMPDHIAAFDLALQPAATPYASPMKVFEYLAMGKPVVACRQPNLEEILTKDKDSLFFTPGEPADLCRVAARLLDDPERLRRMGEEAHRTIDERGFLWRANAQRAIDLYRGAKNGERGPAAVGFGSLE